MDKINGVKEPYEVAVVVVPRYSQLTLAAVIEPMRMANTVSGRNLYSWRLASDSGVDVASSSGFTLSIGDDIGDIARCDALFVLASYEPRRFASPRLLAFLRRISKTGAFIGGFDGAPYLLAAAGVLDGHRATTHWDDIEDFGDRYPRVDVTPERYVIDRGRATTSGSLPSFDFILELIRQRHGLVLAMNVSGNFLYDQARPGSEQQFMIAASQLDARHPKIRQVVRLMEETVPTPLAIAELADSVGMSERTLLRRFRDALGVTPDAFYRELRLDVGRRLLENHDLSILEVALACGFDSRPAFTRAFKKVFGAPPSTRRISSATNVS